MQITRPYPFAYMCGRHSRVLRLDENARRAGGQSFSGHRRGRRRRTIGRTRTRGVLSFVHVDGGASGHRRRDESVESVTDYAHDERPARVDALNQVVLLRRRLRDGMPPQRGCVVHQNVHPAVRLYGLGNARDACVFIP